MTPYHKLTNEEKLSVKTLGDLKARGYKPESIKDEIRRNYIKSIREKKNIFFDIHGYNDTVLPNLERAILSRHNINLLGLRGQAKTKIARRMIEFCDDYIPVIEGSMINDDPLTPISAFGKELIKSKKENCPIAWIHKEERYTEKLATPDVSVSDLIGDIDPIKAVSQKLSLLDEKAIHYGLVPRSNRCIFVINEIPDLQARIQVSLFNILQEGDIQIRGFKLRMPLNIYFIFTANPEDYTNRGSIVTPLKDRIGSQILTHYPADIAVGKQITTSQSKLSQNQISNIGVFDLAKDLIEQIAIEARESEYVDSKSGVSARLTISAYENLISTAERRMLVNNEKKTFVRVSDFIGIIPAITGKIELVYEGEQEGITIVAKNLINKAIRTLFVSYFPDPEQIKKQKNKKDPYQKTKAWFEQGNMVDLLFDASDKDYQSTLDNIKDLGNIVNQFQKTSHKHFRYFLMEFILFGLCEFSILSKHTLERGSQFKDLFDNMFRGNDKEAPLEDDFI